MDLKVLHRLIAGALLVISLVVYLSTVAPTLSFWDCGEFIACAYTLGVPHPPGSPLFLLLGNLFSRLPFGDIGWRVNLLSVLVSALSVMLTYLTVVRLIRNYRGKETTLLDGIVIYGSSALAASAFAFTHSFWFNAVEAEVYAMSLFFTAIVFYLIVRWWDEADDPQSDRLLLLIAYCMGLATGVHLLNILAIPSIALMIYFRKYKLTFTGFFVTVGLSIIAFLVIYPGIIKYLPAAFEVSSYFPFLIVLAIAYGCYWALKNHRRVVSLVFVSTFLIVLGYSTYSFLYIRSGLNPTIDENNPDNVHRLLYYLNREQYGDTGMFPRRWNNDPTYSSASDFFWSYQVDHMYNRYLLWQFVGQEGDFQGASVNFSEFYALPLLLGLFGLGYHAVKDRKYAFVVFSMFFMTGYAIIIYLNQDNPQPRERDYSYVGSFYAFALWLGIGAQGLLDALIKWLKGKDSVKYTLFALVILFIALPVNMLVKSYNTQSRAGNYIPWDYSRNILETCDRDAILFTNGDNDTFPLWYLQEVMNVRKDVRIVNVSLLNTGWYIRQLKYQDPKVPMTFSDDYIDRYLDQNDMTALRARYWPKDDPKKPTVLRLETPNGGTIEWDIPATIHLPTGQGDSGKPNFLRVQDIMIIDIVRANKWKRPIYFAVTVSNSNMVGLDNYLTMEGLGLRLNPTPDQKIDPDKLLYNLMAKYSNNYRNLGNPKVHYDDNVYRLLQNYRSAFMQLATHYLTTDKPGTATYSQQKAPSESLKDFKQFSDRDKVLFIMDSMERYIPEEVIPITSDEISLQIGQLYKDLGRPEELEKRLHRAASRDNLPGDRIFRYGAMYLQWLNDTVTAKEMFNKALKVDPRPEMKIELAAAYRQMGMNQDALNLLNEVKSQPMDNDNLAKMGTLYYHMGQDAQAEEIFRDLTLKNPNDGQAFGGLLMVYERQRAYTKAVDLLQNWVSAHPNDPQAAERLNHFKTLAAGGSP
jgi:tetratricopeptide (TPR) repeat protein